ncbi:MAG: toprim domain-containing protein [Patescibacteria group bacterium]|nr:toprim domain-containing protein [Patescibacteria group bacterium]
MRRLEEIFAHFPGIGPRQAKRFVYYLLNRPSASIKEFTDLIHEVKTSTAECNRCHRFFMSGNREAAGGGRKTVVCPTCADTSRDSSLLMVVARDSDFESIERSGAYKGLYFVLGGTVPVLDKEPDKRIRLKGLLARLAQKDSPIKEVILSLNTTPDGENTAETVKHALLDASGADPLSSTETNIKLTVLGRGLSTGAELEYVDGETIRNALLNRH